MINAFSHHLGHEANFLKLYIQGGANAPSDSSPLSAFQGPSEERMSIDITRADGWGAALYLTRPPWPLLQ